MIRGLNTPIKCNSGRGQNVSVPGNYISKQIRQNDDNIKDYGKGPGYPEAEPVKTPGCLGPGEKVDVDTLPEGRVVVKAAGQAGTISDFIGCLSQQTSRRLTIDEINEITEQGWAQER